MGTKRTEIKSGGCSAVILAAGLSSRMKAFKPLLPVNGKPAIAGLIKAVKSAGISDIIVVTGHEREKLAPLLRRLCVREEYNANYEQGMMTSVKAGIAKAAGSGQTGCILMPADCPLISAEALRKVLKAAGGDEFAVATFEGKKGHPLYIPACRIREIMEYDGPGGLAAVTDRHSEGMLRVETGEEGCVLDMDTPEGYEAIKNFAAVGFKRRPIKALAEGRHIFLVRHGETEPHEGSVFMGQHDAALSEKGRQSAAGAGVRIARLLEQYIADGVPPVRKIYSSDLMRAAESAEIIRKRAELLCGGQIEICLDRGLREINLGPWDGRLISEIRTEFPEEYARRGQDMFAFKLRGMENFYDLQYRVKAAFRDILVKDKDECIIIVAHSGVIRVLENTLRGMRVDDDWEPLEKGGVRALPE